MDQAGVLHRGGVVHGGLDGDAWQETGGRCDVIEAVNQLVNLASERERELRRELSGLLL